MQKYAVIVAGGTGSRMGGPLPKQFMLLKGQPLIYHSVKTFVEAYEDIHVILVLPQEHLQKGSEMIASFFREKDIRLVAGGETRFHSVKNGLSLVAEESIIFVHDGVRCLLTADLVHRCYEMAMKTGSAIPAIPSKDSVRLLDGERSEPLEREKIMLIQTPQTFHSKILLPAYQIDFKDRFTDEANVVETYGIKVSLVEGEESNIKITRPVDLLVAEGLLGRP